MKPIRAEYQAAAIYLAFGLTWILLSDWVVNHLLGPQLAVAAQTFKGLFFIALTTLMVFFLVRRGTRRMRESEALYRALFENNHAVMLIIDPAAGLVVDANPAAAAWYGWPRQKMRGMEISRINTLSPAEIQAEMTLVASGAKRHLLFRHRRADASERDVEVYSGPVELFGKRVLYSLVFDVTDRKQAERELWASKQHIEALLDASPLAVVTLDRQGRVLSWSPSAERLFGWAAPETLGNPVPFVTGFEATAFREEIGEVFEGGALTGRERKLLRKDGAALLVRFSASPVRDDGAHISRIVALLDDVTEQHHLTEQLQQARRMEAIGQLAGGVAHDFNNILQAMLGYCHLLLTDDSLTSPAREQLKEIERSAERAAALTRQLLTFSRRQAMRLEPLDLNGVVEGVLGFLRRTLGEHIALDFRPGSDIGEILADRSMMEQVLLNLCINARDAMPGGGFLTLSTGEALPEDLPANRPPSAARRYAQLSVSDNGHGMDEQTRLRVFEPFFTTKEQGKGTGLGLATVYGIVQQHGGLIEVVSAPGAGTTFHVYLPCPEDLPRHPRPQAPAPPPGGTETILLAEDDEAVRAFARTVLERAGYTVWAVPDGEEAVGLVRARGDAVDALVLDVVMPRLGGIEAFHQIQALRPSLPVVFSSGYNRLALRDLAELQNVATLLQKPFRSEELLHAVRQALGAGPSESLPGA